MPERIRARKDGALVTILKGKPGKRGKCEIRNQFGYVETVDGKLLEPINPNEPDAVLKYGEDVD